MNVDTSILSLMLSLTEVPTPKGLLNYNFCTLYALSKIGSIRVYKIRVEDKGDHAVVTTTKQTTLGGKETTDQYEYWSGVNIGKRNETTYQLQALLEAQSRYEKLLDAGFTTEMPSTCKKFNTDKNGCMKPMLAISFCEDKINFPCICQPKYDGVRCLVFVGDDNKINIVSRKGKPYVIPHLLNWAECHRDLLPLDGELYNHKELTFQEIISAVKKLSPITDQIRYVVYDKPVTGVPNKQRWSELKKSLRSINGAPVYLSTSAVCYNMLEVEEYHDKCAAEGYEGVIIRNYDGLYEFGFRSSNLIKRKEFTTEEFKIADVVEASGRDSGTAIFVLYLPGREDEELTYENSFRAKPQGSRELRTEYFREKENLIGKMVTIQYQGLSDSGVPRFPVGLTIRDYE